MSASSEFIVTPNLLTLNDGLLCGRESGQNGHFSYLGRTEELKNIPVEFWVNTGAVMLAVAALVAGFVLFGVFGNIFLIPPLLTFGCISGVIAVLPPELPVSQGIPGFPYYRPGGAPDPIL
jgi:hypothetical protein